MTNDPITLPEAEPETAERPAWTTPLLEEAGTIHDVEGGALAGNDTYGAPSAIS